MACAHEVVLNGACYYCGSTDLDPEALSPKPLIPAADLVRRPPRRSSDDADAPEPSTISPENTPET